jgi:prepilin-type N-terminal cleavage/methylation domain-containing protein
MRNKILNPKGFTLIELIIVFSVLSILAVAGLASFVKYSRVQTISNDSQNIVSAINLAKSKTISQIKPLECSSDPGTNRVLEGYNVTFSAGGVYDVNVLCSGGYSKQVNSNHYKLSKEIDYHADTNISSIRFKVISGGVIVTATNGSEITDGTGIIKLSGFSNSECRVIKIKLNGTITNEPC